MKQMSDYLLNQNNYLTLSLRLAFRSASSNDFKRNALLPTGLQYFIIESYIKIRNLTMLIN